MSRELAFEVLQPVGSAHPPDDQPKDSHARRAPKVVRRHRLGSLLRRRNGGGGGGSVEFDGLREGVSERHEYEGLRGRRGGLVLLQGRVVRRPRPPRRRAQELHRSAVREGCEDGRAMLLMLEGGVVLVAVEAKPIRELEGMRLVPLRVLLQVVVVVVVVQLAVVVEVVVEEVEVAVLVALQDVPHRVQNRRHSAAAHAAAHGTASAVADLKEGERRKGQGRAQESGRELLRVRRGGGGGGGGGLVVVVKGCSLCQFRVPGIVEGGSDGG